MVGRLQGYFILSRWREAVDQCAKFLWPGPGWRDVSTRLLAYQLNRPSL